MAAKVPSRALAVYEPNQFAVLNPETASEVLAAVQENMDGGELRLIDLAKVTVPAGGGRSWERVDGLTGEVDAMPVVSGVIVGVVSQRIYFARSIDDGGGKTPPDCASDDGITGVGNPGGDCATCPMAQFGSAKGGEAAGQACSQVMRIAVLEQGENALPLIVNVPPSSLRQVRQYLLALTTAGKRRSRVITNFALESTSNAGGVKYSYIKPAIGGTLSPDAGPAVDAYIAGIEHFLRAQPPQRARPVDPDVIEASSDLSGLEPDEQ